MAAKNGRRPPATRLRTRAVMNTVLPERASPVTPSLSVGAIRSRRAAPALLRASAVEPVKSESRTAVAFLGSSYGKERGRGKALAPLPWKLGALPSRAVQRQSAE